jgi:hypothetical protein
MKPIQEINIISSIDELKLETPGTYAMDLAVEVLEFIERNTGAYVKNTGWRQGFGLEAAVGIPIRLDNLEAELSTDGSDITLSRISGSRRAFSELCDAIRSNNWHREPNLPFS